MVATVSGLLDTLKRVASALKRADVTFALGGGYAVYARGGPAPEHDVDFVLPEADVERALAALDEVGYKLDRPPEDWLVKAYENGRQVDLIFLLNGRPVDADLLGRAERMEVGSVRMLVLSATDLLVSRLRAFSEHNCDFGAALPMVRALREQVDWRLARSETGESPYAHAFFDLVGRLDLLSGGVGADETKGN